MTRFITRDGTILTPTECKWIAEFRRWTPTQQAEALKLVREWTKDKD
jgi:hypothetical protein